MRRVEREQGGGFGLAITGMLGFLIIRPACPTTRPRRSRGWLGVGYVLNPFVAYLVPDVGPMAGLLAVHPSDALRGSA